LPIDSSEDSVNTTQDINFSGEEVRFRGWWEIREA
jgi:hypothetical protein